MDADRFYDQFSSSPEIAALRKLPTAEDFRTQTDRWLDDSQIEDWLGRLERAIVHVQEKLAQQADEKNQFEELLQSASSSGQKCALFRWPQFAQTSEHSRFTDARALWSAFRDSPFSGYPAPLPYLVKRATSKSVHFMEKDLIGTVPRTGRLKDLQAAWILGFLRALNPAVKVEILSPSSPGEQKWEL